MTKHCVIRRKGTSSPHDEIIIIKIAVSPYNKKVTKHPFITRILIIMILGVSFGEKIK